HQSTLSTTLSTSPLDGNGNSGNISVVSGGDLFVDGDVAITTGEMSAEGEVAGSINIAASKDIEISGSIRSTNSTEGGSGGFVSIVAEHDLTIHSGAVISSAGEDGGADLVHLEGCHVLIAGEVSSEAGGDEVPEGALHLSGDFRPDK